MGREAVCHCDWAGIAAEVKALIEPPDLILRGGVKRRLPLIELQEVRADGEQLRFTFQGENIAITLGSALAAKWAHVITTPPPSLAMKLGITSGITVHMVGLLDDGALEGALAAAKQVSTRMGELIVARVDTPDDVARTLKSTASELARGTPIWFVYPKGRGQALSEGDVRAMGLAAGVVDTKVAAVSQRLTALRFIRRRSPKIT